MLSPAIVFAVLLTFASITDGKNPKHKPHPRPGLLAGLPLPLPELPLPDFDDLPLPGVDELPRLPLPDRPLPLPLPGGKPPHHHNSHPPHPPKPGHEQHHPPKPGHEQHHPPKPGHHENLPGSPMRECRLEGWWVSEVGLIMYINEEVPHGFTVEFDGYFYKNHDKKIAATIRGARTKVTNSREGTFGFTVSFPAGQTAVWVGQCYDDHHKLSLETAMLHRVPSPLFESWLSTKFATQTWHKMPQPPPWFDPRNIV